MDVTALRQVFVQKVSWGPTKISFSDAIRALDEALLEAGFGERVVPSSYTPASDAIGVPVAISASELVTQVFNEVKKKGRKVKEEEVMGLDEHQENADIITKMGIR